jgi:CRP/FNR family cyclic AMP-dependent transcriptional regulator
MSCNVEELAEVEYFKEVKTEDLRTLAEVVNVVKLEPHKILFHAGEPGDSLYIVKSGEIELYVKDTTGQKIVLSVVHPGDLFGELSMIDRMPRTATALSLIETELFSFNREALISLFQKQPESALSLLSAMSGKLRKADELIRTRVSRNVNEEMEEKISPVERVIDWIAWFGGSIQFFLINFLWFAGWIAVNTLPLGIPKFDEYPFGLLTMIVSLESIFLSCFVLISQNRQAEKDRVRSDIEYDVNIKAELEVAHLHEKTDQIYEQMLEKFDRLEKLVKKQKSESIN